MFNIPELLLACKEKGLISREEIKQIMDELRIKTYYFKKEVEGVLLERLSSRILKL